MSSAEQESSQTKEEEESERLKAREAASKAFYKSFSLGKLIDPTQPWVLVPNGSFLGYFNFVPEMLRVGPWSVAAICYLTALLYATLMASAYFTSFVSTPWWSTDLEALDYPPAGSIAWWYNCIACPWMIYIMYLILSGPLSYKAWITFTVQSWTLLTVRHGLVAAAPWSSTAQRWAEYTRFPVACSATITFTVWNFVLMPFIYFVAFKTDEKRAAFLKFCTSFRLLNVHGLNIVLVYVNCAVTSPSRRLDPVDLYLSVVSVMVYMGWYLGVLDRIGVHLYPVFSPRAGFAVVASTWTSLIACYFACYFGWRELLWPQP